MTVRNIGADSTADPSSTTTVSPSTIPILLGPPRHSTKWIYWTTLSALVRYSNETALSAHHLSACRPASWSTVSTVCVSVRGPARVLGLTLSQSQGLSRAGCEML